MGVDRIGKGSPPSAEPAKGTDGPPSIGEKRPFELGSQSPGGVSASTLDSPAPVEGENPLDSYRAGRINLETYLDRTVEASTEHLQGLPADELRAIRSALRSQLETDPFLVDLVHRATGEPPPSSE